MKTETVCHASPIFGVTHDHATFIQLTLKTACLYDEATMGISEHESTWLISRSDVSPTIAALRKAADELETIMVRAEVLDRAKTRLALLTRAEPFPF